MTSPIEKLREYGYELPAPKAAGRQLCAGHPHRQHPLCLRPDFQRTSRASSPAVLGDNMNVVQGGNAAELAALNILSQIVHTGRRARSKTSSRCSSSPSVASTPDFFEQHLVANGASNLLVGVLGDKGKHARAAFGVAALPLGAAVEVEAIIEVEG